MCFGAVFIIVRMNTYSAACPPDAPSASCCTRRARTRRRGRSSWARRGGPGRYGRQCPGEARRGGSRGTCQRGAWFNVLTVVFFLTFQWLVFCATVRRVRMVLCFSGWCSILQCEMVSFFSGWCSMLQCEGMCESIMFQCELFHVQCEKWCHDSA